MVLVYLPTKLDDFGGKCMEMLVNIPAPAFGIVRLPGFPYVWCYFPQFFWLQRQGPPWGPKVGPQCLCGLVTTKPTSTGRARWWNTPPENGNFLIKQVRMNILLKHYDIPWWTISWLYMILYVLPNFKSHPFKRPWKVTATKTAPSGCWWPAGLRPGMGVPGWLDGLL